MKSYLIHFITLKKSVSLQLQGPDTCILEDCDLVRDLRTVSSFKKSYANTFAIVVSDSLKKLYLQLQNKYSKAFPRFRAAVSLLYNTPNGKLFVVSFNENLDNLKYMRLYAFIEEFEGGRSQQEIMKEFYELYGDAIKRYNYIGDEDKEILRIGPQDRKQRRCRYCGKMMPETTFRNDSHTISEALGNKVYFTNDECDDCNSHFGSGDGIEADFIAMISPCLTVYGIKGKKRIPTFNCPKFRLDYDKNHISPYPVIVKTTGSTEVADNQKDSFYQAKKKYIPQNAYRALCKYAIGMLPSEYVPMFAKTIEWINGIFTEECLPEVMMRFTNEVFQQPLLTIAIRKDHNKDIPFAFAELKVVNMCFVYILPFVNNEEYPPKDNEIYVRWWQLLKYYHSESWNKIDLSKSTSVELTFNFKFHKHVSTKS